MYHHLTPQIKGSMEKEQVLLANNLFVSSYFNKQLQTYTFACPSCIFHSVVCFFESQVAAGVAACFGWMVWMVAGVGGCGFRGVNICSRK